MSETTKDQIERNKRLIAQYQQSVRSEGSKLLKVLPQGPGSSLNADLLDGQHAEEIISKAAKLGGKRGHGGAVVGVGGDMTKAVYDTDTDNVVESADNADTVDGVHAAGFLQGTWTSGTCTVSNGGTAAHGLGGTPTRVLMSVNALQPYAYSWTADATNITFHHSAAATLIINWLARL